MKQYYTPLVNTNLHEKEELSNLINKISDFSNKKIFIIFESVLTESTMFMTTLNQNTLYFIWSKMEKNEYTQGTPLGMSDLKNNINELIESWETSVHLS